MNRHTFLGLLGAAATAPLRRALAARPHSLRLLQPEQLLFADDGRIPNSRLPVLLYRRAFAARGAAGAAWLEQRFAAHDWRNSWRNGIYSFLHYHSTAHEVLGIYAGQARLQLGGERGQSVRVAAGDVLIIPAGVGHQNLDSEQLGVVGAYPQGRHWDLNRGRPGERPATDRHIAALPLPATDPLLGPRQGLPRLWT